jgi:hypothetical protein
MGDPRRRASARRGCGAATQPETGTMAKGQLTKKMEKKQPAKTFKEKREAKKVKKEEKKKQ